MVTKIESHGSDRRIRGVTSYNSWNPKLVLVILKVFGFWNDDVIITFILTKVDCRRMVMHLVSLIDLLPRGIGLIFVVHVVFWQVVLLTL